MCLTLRGPPSQVKGSWGTTTAISVCTLVVVIDSISVSIGVQYIHCCECQSLGLLKATWIRTSHECLTGLHPLLLRQVGKTNVKPILFLAGKPCAWGVSHSRISPETQREQSAWVAQGFLPFLQPGVSSVEQIWNEISQAVMCREFEKKLILTFICGFHCLKKNSMIATHKAFLLFESPWDFTNPSSTWNHFCSYHTKLRFMVLGSKTKGAKAAREWKGFSIVFLWRWNGYMKYCGTCTA